MKKLLFLIILFFAVYSVKAQENSFSTKALNDVMLTNEEVEITFFEILDLYKGKTIFIDIWAGWCSDCVKGMPKVKKIQKNNKNAVFLFLSLDKSTEKWKKAIKALSIEGEHYYIASGWKGDFCSSLNLDWIPRYMVVNPEGKIVLYKAIKADDERISKALNN
jgi:thiol-disulfide isomerase/thioredoxin